MLRIFMLFSVALALLVAACQSEAPTGPELRRVGPIFPAVLNCNGIPNGGVTRVITTPSTHSIDLSFYQQRVTNAEVWRDDPNTPGVQQHCVDTAVAVAWSITNTVVMESHLWCCGGVGPQYAWIDADAAGTSKLIATLSGKKDTTTVTVVN